MGSSADFRAYCEAEIQELDRLRRIYLGEESDQGVRAEHLIPNDLPKVLQRPLPQNLVSIYSGEYSTLMAGARAAAMANLTRKHFYEYASMDAEAHAKYLHAELARHEADAGVTLSAMSAEDRQALQDINDSAEQEKSEVLFKLEADRGLGGRITSRTAMQAIFSGKANISAFGTRSEATAPLVLADAVNYEGFMAQMVCKCGCRQVVADPTLISLLEALEAEYGKFTITSGYRCPAHNVAVGGAKNSFHMKGLAVDIAVSTRERDNLLASAKKVGFNKGFGLGETFLHLDVGDRGTDRPVAWTYGNKGAV